MSTPRFFQQPIKYLRWASHEKQAIFYATIVGLMGPAALFYAPPLRRLFNDDAPRERIPFTYPSMGFSPYTFNCVDLTII